MAPQYRLQLPANLPPPPAAAAAPKLNFTRLSQLTQIMHMTHKKERGLGRTDRQTDRLTDSERQIRRWKREEEKQLPG